MIDIATLFATVGINTDPLNKGLGSASQSLKGFGKEIAKQVIGTVSLGTAVYKAGKTVIDSIRDWADYADTMRLSAQMAGITTEEMSRLTQAADDFRVPMEVMQRSMEMALKNGFVPTIDNLAALSDRLLAINDPALRAAEASEIFGKSYADMMPFLMAGGDAIRSTTDGIADNLIVTAESAKQAKEYKDALDNLSDTWTGLKNTLGQNLVPVMTDAFIELTKEIDQTAIELEWFSTMLDYFGTKPFNADNLQKYGQALGFFFNNVGQADGEHIQYMIDSLAVMNLEMGNTGDVAKYATEGIEDATEGIDEMNAAALAAAEAQAKMNAELANITTLDANYQGIIDLAYEYTDMLEEKETLQIERQKLISQGWSDQSRKIKDLDTSIAGLDAEMARMADQVTLDMFQATIAIGGVTETELDAYMQMAIDMGLMSEEGARAAIEAYGNAIKTINEYEIDEKTGNVVVDAVAAFVTLDLLQQYQLLDKEQRVFVRTYYGTSGNYDPYENYTGPQYEHGGGASGGYFMADTPYIVGERGPELFVPSTSGRIIPNDELGGRVINNYTLIMPTTANAGDVRMAFELMEAWA